MAGAVAIIQHPFNSTKADGSDTTVVRPSNWNASHNGVQFARKTTNETVNNSSVMQNDDDISLTVAANEVWYFDIVLHYTTATAADLKVQLTVPAAATATIWYTAFDLNLVATVAGNAPASSALTFGGLTSADLGARLSGVYVGGANAGTLQLQWAQNTADVSNTIVYAGSTGMFIRLA